MGLGKIEKIIKLGVLVKYHEKNYC
jgi:hypothetical protein